MTFEEIEAAPISLGAFLKSTRREKGLDINAVTNETKISERNLRAIEEGDFTLLPAEVFARGFYRLYAKTLSLDPDEIIARYDKERGTQPRTPSILSAPAIKNGEDVGSMAERPSMLPSSTIGLALIILLLFGGFLCWYFSWNPASFFSQKLRSLQDRPEVIEQVQADRQVSSSTTALVSIFDIFSLQEVRAEKMPSIDSKNLDGDEPSSHSTSASIEYITLKAQTPGRK